VVGRRRDQPDARLRVAQARDLRAHLVAGQLAALARLGALRHLDVELVGERAVLGVTPKRPDAICLIRELRSRAVPRVRNRAGSSPPSPQLLFPPIMFIAIASVSWASADSEPCDIAPVENRRVIASTGSTSSRGTGGPAARSRAGRAARWWGAATRGSRKRP